MATMKIDLAGALRNAARMVRKPNKLYGEMVAFNLEEIATHVDQVRSGEASLAEFCELYDLPWQADASPAGEERRWED